MGKIYSSVKHPLKNYNLENRAHKIISKPKPVPAPRHAKDQLDFERLMKEFPEAYQEGLKKHDQLDKHLKDIYVTSHDPNVDPEQQRNSLKPLPTDRRQVQEYMFGVLEPEIIPQGKTTLSKALEFITKHQAEPQEYSVKKIVDEYALPEENVKNILKYFRVFEIYIPQDRNPKAKFAGPSRPKVRIIKHLKKQLLPDSDQKHRKQLPQDSHEKDKT